MMSTVGMPAEECELKCANDDIVVVVVISQTLGGNRVFESASEGPRDSNARRSAH